MVHIVMLIFWCGVTTTSCPAVMLTNYKCCHTTAGNTNMPTRCHTEMRKSGHAVVLICWQACKPAPEEVPWFGLLRWCPACTYVGTCAAMTYVGLICSRGTLKRLIFEGSAAQQPHTIRQTAYKHGNFIDACHMLLVFNQQIHAHFLVILANLLKPEQCLRRPKRLVVHYESSFLCTGTDRNDSS